MAISVAERADGEGVFLLQVPLAVVLLRELERPLLMQGPWLPRVRDIAHVQEQAEGLTPLHTLQFTAPARMENSHMENSHMTHMTGCQRSTVYVHFFL